MKKEWQPKTWADVASTLELKALEARIVELETKLGWKKMTESVAEAIEQAEPKPNLNEWYCDRSKAKFVDKHWHDKACWECSKPREQEERLNHPEPKSRQEVTMEITSIKKGEPIELEECQHEWGSVANRYDSPFEDEVCMKCGTPKPTQTECGCKWPSCPCTCDHHVDLHSKAGCMWTATPPQSEGYTGGTSEVEPWQPKEGEKYWSIFLTEGTFRVWEYEWNAYEVHAKRLAIGDVFKTKEEAEAMADKIAKLLQEGK